MPNKPCLKPLCLIVCLLFLFSCTPGCTQQKSSEGNMYASTEQSPSNTELFPQTDNSQGNSERQEAESENYIYPPSLDLGARFKYDDPSHRNTISVYFDEVMEKSSYSAKGKYDTDYEEYVPRSGYTFIFIGATVTHVAHKGDGVNYRVQTPQTGQFELLYKGREYSPNTGITLLRGHGDAYQQKTLDRYESNSGWLIFEVPLPFNCNNARVTLDLEGSNDPLWKLVVS